MRLLTLLLVAIGTPHWCSAQNGKPSPKPIIDMHLHAMHANEMGPPPMFICAPNPVWPVRDTRTPGEEYGATFTEKPPCASPLRSPLTDDDLMRKTVAIMRARNVTAVTSGDVEVVDKWKSEGGERILRAIPFDPRSGKPTIGQLRQLVQTKQIDAFAEVSSQYFGIPPDDPRMEPYYALAEELDIPVGIHLGPGPPGAAYYISPNYRARNSSLLLLEDVLVRHPKLRIWAMHAGWPLADDTIATLYAHPQLYVDVGVISYAFPRKQFYNFLQRLIDAGFENRIMFGSDEMLWPDALSAAIDSIEKAPFLSHQQKRDILYNNAVRFLRIKKAQ
jgi:predicted TIM-barrel fold metal-dependent hydrolase